MTPLRYQPHYKRNLPHYQPPGATFFITFRLAGSLPKAILDELDAVRAGNSDQMHGGSLSENLYFQHFDSVLDQNVGEQRLDKAEIAEIIQNSLQFLDGKAYKLLAYCIMPNHVHTVIEPLKDECQGYQPLSKIMQSLKGFTARKANELLGRSGEFWQHESYDHTVRDEKDLEQVIAYLLNNPVKAGLVDHSDQWKWLYCKFDKMKFNR